MRRDLRLCQHEFVAQIGRIPEYRHPEGSRHDLLEQLELFSYDLGSKDG